jgi:hypothetical protein
MAVTHMETTDSLFNISAYQNIGYNSTDLYQPGLGHCFENSLVGDATHVFFSPL